MENYTEMLFRPSHGWTLQNKRQNTELNNRGNSCVTRFSLICRLSSTHWGWFALSSPRVSVISFPFYLTTGSNLNVSVMFRSVVQTELHLNSPDKREQRASSPPGPFIFLTFNWATRSKGDVSPMKHCHFNFLSLAFKLLSSPPKGEQSFLKWKGQRRSG